MQSMDDIKSTKTIWSSAQSYKPQQLKQLKLYIPTVHFLYDMVVTYAQQGYNCNLIVLATQWFISFRTTPACFSVF